jgi:uncharacterized protein (DUF983 family)
MSRGGADNATGGIACPSCGDPAPFERFTDLDECPFCGTPLAELMSRAR